LDRHLETDADRVAFYWEGSLEILRKLLIKIFMKEFADYQTHSKN
jgi:hypothetical protein